MQGRDASTPASVGGQQRTLSKVMLHMSPAEILSICAIVSFKKCPHTSVRSSGSGGLVIRTSSVSDELTLRRLEELRLSDILEGNDGLQRNIDITLERRNAHTTRKNFQ